MSRDLPIECTSKESPAKYLPFGRVSKRVTRGGDDRDVQCEGKNNTISRLQNSQDDSNGKKDVFDFSSRSLGLYNKNVDNQLGLVVGGMASRAGGSSRLPLSREDLPHPNRLRRSKPYSGRPKPKQNPISSHLSHLHRKSSNYLAQSETVEEGSKVIKSSFKDWIATATKSSLAKPVPRFSVRNQMFPSHFSSDNEMNYSHSITDERNTTPPWSSSLQLLQSAPQLNERQSRADFMVKSCQSQQMFQLSSDSKINSTQSVSDERSKATSPWSSSVHLLQRYSNPHQFQSLHLSATGVPRSTSVTDLSDDWIVNRFKYQPSPQTLSKFLEE